MRKICSLNEGWRFFKDEDLPDLTGSKGDLVTLPHTWSTNEDSRRGVCRYIRELSRPELADGARLWLEINGAAHTCEVSMNGKMLARHEGGYSTFRADLTDALQEHNVLAISVDNRDSRAVYPQKADFTFYGGLYRDVKLITVPAAHFALGYCGTPGIKVTPVVDLERRSAEVTVEAWVQGGAQMVTFTVDDRQQTAFVEDGHAQAVFTIENARLWDGVDDPYLYTASASLSSGDEVSTHFGCRRFEIDPQKGFLLNGRPYRLYGASRHQDRADVGNALTLEHHKEDMAIIRELGTTSMRLAHYQHAQEFYDLCDENGIIVWAEIPYITMHMKDGRSNTIAQMEELIVQNYNHPCTAVWGLSNEITAASAVNEDLLENHRILNHLCHRLDPTRPTTMASVYTLDTDSPILDIPDVNSYNLYFGWYLGETKQVGEFFDAYHAKFPDRPIGFSEYGADANPQFQAACPQRGDYTEGYQALYHEQLWAQIEERPWVWATHAWNLFDFGADGRDEGGKHGQNQKGLVTFDRAVKKDAFYFYKAVWNKTEPFIHLCGRRYADRTEDVTEVKAYSNQPEVTLYVDGEAVETQAGATVFRFQVPITGGHTIEAKAGDCSDRMQIQKVSQPNAGYVYDKKKDVVNWFDQDGYDPACYSVSDTVAALRTNPQTAEVVNEVLAKVAASSGGDPKQLQADLERQRMMGRVTLQNLLKFAGGAFSKDDIRQINRVLQTIKKPER